jgi:hypothetical protein
MRTLPHVPQEHRGHAWWAASVASCSQAGAMTRFLWQSGCARAQPLAPAASVCSRQRASGPRQVGTILHMSLCASHWRTSWQHSIIGVQRATEADTGHAKTLLALGVTLTPWPPAARRAPS